MRESFWTSCYLGYKSVSGTHPSGWKKEFASGRQRRTCTGGDLLFGVQSVEQGWAPRTGSLCAVGCWNGTSFSVSAVLGHSVVSNSLLLHELYSPPGSSVLGIFQARKLEWTAISFSSVSAETPRNGCYVPKRSLRLCADNGEDKTCLNNKVLLCIELYSISYKNL